MDAVSELAARATLYIIVLQDALAWQPASHRPALLDLPVAEVPALCAVLWQEPMLAKRARALAASATGLPPAYAVDVADPTLFEGHAQELLTFLQQRRTALGQPAAATTAPGASAAAPPVGPRPFRVQRKSAPPVHSAPSGVTAPFLAPEAWRQALYRVLYQDRASRVALAQALNYLPSLIYNLCPPAPAPPSYVARLKNRWRQLHTYLPFGAPPAGPARPSRDWKYYLQLPNAELARELGAARLAVPFELMFGRELTEVTTRRTTLASPPAAPTSTPPAPPADPLAHAHALELCALALSGGGIRTATFNLGVLQGLAGAGWLPRFDYLSTVSGGGYLGSWLAAWIKREGSLAKVVARLCPTASPLPQADEVRPIRWLRMYSNYLAPKTGRLTTDSWTIGVTWLRNTLLNQFIIVLALAAVLALGSAALYAWFSFAWCRTVGWPAWPLQVVGVGVLLLVPATWLAGRGMRPFWEEAPPGSAPNKRDAIRWQLPLLALAGAYVTSSFFYHSEYPGFGAGCGLLWPVAVAATTALVLVAWWGRYDKCFYRLPYGTNLVPKAQRWAWGAIVGTSALAAAVGLAALVVGWKLLSLLVLPAPVNSIPRPVAPNLAAFYPQVRLYGAYILGVPLVLEALVVAVVTRMAVLGRNFPDERREWWGRMGAVLHRAMAAWMLLASSTLLMRYLARLIADPAAFGIPLQATEGTEGLVAALLTGSWLTLVGKAVQLAFSARTRATKLDAPEASTWRDQVLSFAPYVFGLGLLVLTEGAVHWLLHYWLPTNAPWATAWPADPAQQLALRALLLSLSLGGVALLLGWRVGVNEFSLHHFYRNRLVRAYLGASRPRFDRERTANSFTGFDHRDDVKLCALQHHDPVLATAAAPTTYDAAPYQGPLLLINATLNVTKVSDLAEQARQAESFVFTPLYCGFDFARIRALNPTRQGSTSFGYRPTQQFAYPRDNGPGVGTAMAISGAAASPNEGYHSSPATAFLLTLFNVRLGWWMGNPSLASTWQKADPRLGLFYLLKDLFGRSKADDAFVNLSDGGHFDNMGLYELVRRRCRYIVLGDAEEDHLFTCEGLANAIRRCRVDFGVEITLDVTPITTRPAPDHLSQAHYAVGTIHYPDDAPSYPTGRLLYLKASLTGDEPTDVREYAAYNAAFPHQSTSDQFFNEAQFESYRRLGLHIFETLRQKSELVSNPAASLAAIFDELAR